MKQVNWALIKSFNESAENKEVEGYAYGHPPYSMMLGVTAWEGKQIEEYTTLR